MDVNRPSLTGQGMPHITSFCNESITEMIFKVDIVGLVSRPTSLIYIHLSTTCLTLAVAGQELEEIDLISYIFLEITLGQIQHLHRAGCNSTWKLTGPGATATANCI